MYAGLGSIVRDTLYERRGGGGGKRGRKKNGKREYTFY
jgi:hypothetical protein